MQTLDSIVIFQDSPEHMIFFPIGTPRDATRCVASRRSALLSVRQRVFAIPHPHNIFYSCARSESSMFVTDRRIIIKTCGSSRLLKLLGAIMRLAKKCGLDIVQVRPFRSLIRAHVCCRLERAEATTVFEILSRSASPTSD